MVIVTPIPGQEERNADYLLEEGTAVRCNDIETIDYKLDLLLGDRGRLEQLRANGRRLGRPDAARLIATTVLADRHEPVQFDWRAQLQATRPPSALQPSRLPWATAPTAVAFYDDERGLYLGMVTNDLYRKLRRFLPDIDAQSGTSAMNTEQVERLRGLGADPQVCDIMQERIARHGPLRIRRSKVPGASRSDE